MFQAVLGTLIVDRMKVGVVASYIRYRKNLSRNKDLKLGCLSTQAEAFCNKNDSILSWIQEFDKKIQRGAIAGRETETKT